MEPGSLDEYLRDTEHAVRHLYAGIESCWAYYRQALGHWDISRVGEPLTPELSAALQNYLALAGKYFDLKVSEATFAGSILQVAAVAIRRFSSNTRIPESCSELVPAKAKGAIPFCVGRLVHGIPAGLVVYAARNQYNHWDAEPQASTRRIFDALCEGFYDDPFYDLAFDIGNPTITIHANEVLLGALCWTTCERYEAEVRGMLTDQGDA